MSLWKIREYKPEDVPELISLWLSNFEDTESFVRAFHEALPELGSAMVAELDGRVIGAAYALNGQELVCPGEPSLQLGFLYGVSVDRQYRRHGAGAAVVSAACELSRAMGAETVAILPARGPLYDWYGAVLGMKNTLFRKVLSVKAQAAERCSVIAPAEYLLRREKLLEGLPHVHLTEASMAFAKTLMREYGGDVYAVCGGVAAAYMDGGLALIRELILPDDGDVYRAAASVACAMGAEEARVFMPSTEGDRYILSDRPLPAGCVWNLSFD